MKTLMKLCDLKKDLKQVLKQETDKPGIYRVYWCDGKKPEFTMETSGKGKNRKGPVDTELFRNKWVGGVSLIYIGQTKRPLRQRIRELVRYGMSEANNHRGGRYMWQIKDIWEHASIDLKECKNPKAEEKKLLADFKKKYGKLPFANLRM